MPETDPPMPDEPTDDSVTPEPTAEPPVRQKPRRSRRSGRAPFTIGRCLSQTLSIWIKNLIPFTILSAVIMSPHIVWTWLNLDATPRTELGFTDWQSAVDFLLPAFLGYIVSAAVIYGVFQQLRGKHASIADSLARGLRALPSVIGALLIILAILAAIFTPMILVMMVSVGFGLVLYLVAVILMMIMFAGLAAVIPVCIFEETGGATALRRSWELTKNYKFTIFLFSVLLGLIQGIVIAVLGGCIGGIMFTTDADNAGRTLVLLTLLIQVFFTSMQSVASTVIYHDLRQTKEGIDTEELASIFQ